MTCLETGALIDRIAAILVPHLGSADAAGAVALEVVAELRGHYVLLAQSEVDAARSDLAGMDVPGLSAKGHAS